MVMLQYVFGMKLGGASAFRIASVSIAVVRAAKQASRQFQLTAKLAKCSFSRDSDDTLESFSGYVLIRFWHEISWCFNVSSGVRQHSFCTCG